jgi:uncharacterized membrane protein YeaQ/YmgE (transglycosylase-associated protein family)
MSDVLRDILITLRAIAIILAIGAAASFIFYSLKKKDLLGGYIGGMVVGVVGAILGALVIDKLFYDITEKVLEFLMRGAGVNIIASFLGAYFAVYIMNKLNHDKSRKKY